jgi:hypothetical protein
MSKQLLCLLFGQYRTAYFFLFVQFVLHGSGSYPINVADPGALFSCRRGFRGLSCHNGVCLFSVVLDETGTSKGFGFIRFGNEIEQQTALTSMQGISGLGGKPIKVI